MSAPAQLLQASALQAVGTAPSFAAIEAPAGSLEPALPASAVPAALEWRTLALRDASYEHGPGLESGTRASTEARRLDRPWEPRVPARRRSLDLVAGLLQPQSGCAHD